MVEVYKDVNVAADLIICLYGICCMLHSRTMFITLSFTVVITRYIYSVISSAVADKLTSVWFAVLLHDFHAGASF